MAGNLCRKGFIVLSERPELCKITKKSDQSDRPIEKDFLRGLRYLNGLPHGCYFHDRVDSENCNALDQLPSRISILLLRYSLSNGLRCRSPDHRPVRLPLWCLKANILWITKICYKMSGSSAVTRRPGATTIYLNIHQSDEQWSSESKGQNSLKLHVLFVDRYYC
jgi:hypothetical protein